MKLRYEEKVTMYRSWKRREKSPGQLARENGLSHGTVEYMLKLMDAQGEEIARHGKNTKKIQEYIQNQLKKDEEMEQLTLEGLDPFTGKKR